GTAWADPRLRHTRRLARLGFGEGDDAGIRDRRPDRGSALGDGRRRHLHLQVRPHGRTDRPYRGPDRGGAARGGVIGRKPCALLLTRIRSPPPLRGEADGRRPSEGGTPHTQQPCGPLIVTPSLTLPRKGEGTHRVRGGVET